LPAGDKTIRNGFRQELRCQEISCHLDRDTPCRSIVLNSRLNLRQLHIEQATPSGLSFLHGRPALKSAQGFLLELEPGSSFINSINTSQRTEQLDDCTSTRLAESRPLIGGDVSCDENRGVGCGARVFFIVISSRPVSYFYSHPHARRVRCALRSHLWLCTLSVLNLRQLHIEQATPSGLSFLHGRPALKSAQGFLLELEPGSSFINSINTSQRTEQLDDCTSTRLAESRPLIGGDVSCDENRARARFQPDTTTEEE